MQVEQTGCIISLVPSETCVWWLASHDVASSVRIYEAGWTRTDDWDSDDDREPAIPMACPAQFALRLRCGRLNGGGESGCC